MKELKTQKNEIRWVTFNNSKGEPIYVISSKPMRDVYFLYKVEDTSLVKKGKSHSPMELEKMVRKSKEFR